MSLKNVDSFMVFYWFQPLIPTIPLSVIPQLKKEKAKEKGIGKLFFTSVPDYGIYLDKTNTMKPWLKNFWR